ncbi:2-polyprenyl-6-methoxyphenol hydroxylase [Halogranum amylolyticum]|uniref:2-polyprenyl-6-methoxyphenol hydroxylase n=2 Tax=Halogranum amylolyticum TaxID=660520 RepID=A0A1H8MUP5_9EURY|nr:2-polyprenyl-6-methoxyphenol hydroxylase [Halogranum amylolyticum]
MGGLFTGIALRAAGHDVDVFERASDGLQSRGAGIVAQSNVREFLETHGIAPPKTLTTTTSRRQYLNRDGSVARDLTERMAFTGWDALYRELRDAFPDARYHTGRRTVDVDPGDDRAVLTFEGGSTVRADLAVVAEGGRSTTRDRLVSGVEPDPAGYVAWRGVVPEGDLPDGVRETFDDVFVFYEGEDELILGYLIPGPEGGTDPDERRLNWVWYDDVGGESDRRRLLTDEGGESNEFSVPPGRLRPEVSAELLAAADDRLPSVFADLVAATDDAFVQTIYDLTVPEMRFGRVCLLGDAAFVARPHTAAGTAKAAADGDALADALDTGGDEPRIEDALRKWSSDRVDEGRRLVEQGIRMGEGYIG